jgi:hypothetical protein
MRASSGGAGADGRDPRGKAMLSFLVGMLLSFLPKRYRERFPESVRGNLRPGAAVSGLVQCLGCLLIFSARYLSFLQQRVGGLGERAIAHGAEEALGATAAQAGMGYVSLVEYIFHPLSLLLIYFALEGAVRFYAAGIVEEIVGTLPLHIVAWAQERVGQARAARALGPRLPDVVESVYSADFDLRIFSCRPKRHWDRLLTVSYEEQLYAVVGEQQGKPPRRFIYQLRKVPLGWIVRNIHYYSPDEVLREEAATPPSLLSRLVGWLEQPRAQAPAGPPVPDVVERIASRAYQLRISSCRPKPTWDHLMTVEYEGEFFEIAEEKPGTAPHPYVYLLRQLPEGKVIRSLHHYRPEESLDK